MNKILEEFVSDAREQIQKEHPIAAQSGPLLASLAEAMGYQAWRATRAYDHIEIVFGVRMRDGSAGYSVDFHDNPVGAPGRITSIHLSSGELRELFSKASIALGGESLWLPGHFTPSHRLPARVVHTDSSGRSTGWSLWVRHSSDQPPWPASTCSSMVTS